MEKILFLDVDGVLNCSKTIKRCNGAFGLDPVLVKRLKKIVDETEVKLVLSSTWRFSSSWRADFEAAGMDLKWFLGQTPYVKGGKRGDEIKAWLEQHPTTGRENRKYAIVDDDADMLPGQVLFQTTFQHGLTEGIMKQIISFFGQVVWGKTQNVGLSIGLNEEELRRWYEAAARSTPYNTATVRPGHTIQRETSEGAIEYVDRRTGAVLYTQYPRVSSEEQSSGGEGEGNGVSNVNVSSEIIRRLEANAPMSMRNADYQPPEGFFARHYMGNWQSPEQESGMRFQVSNNRMFMGNAARLCDDGTTPTPETLRVAGENGATGSEPQENTQSLVQPSNAPQNANLEVETTPAGELQGIRPDSITIDDTYYSLSANNALLRGLTNESA